jgi:hypothetical protein
MARRFPFAPEAVWDRVDRERRFRLEPRDSSRLRSSSSDRSLAGKRRVADAVQTWEECAHQPISRRERIRMRARSIGPIMVSCALASILYGCTSMKPMSTSGSNQSCTWTFDRGPTGKVIAGSLKVKAKENVSAEACKVQESASFSIQAADNDWTLRVTDSTPAEFTLQPDRRDPTRAWCRNCYPNGSGGMTCVTYWCP